MPLPCHIRDMVAGHVVRITTQPLTGRKPQQELFDVAIADPKKAVAKVMNVKNTTPDEKVEIVDSLSDSAVKALGLKPGEVRPR